MPSARKHNAQRMHMAQIAARLIHEQGIRDFQVAKRKAAQHLGIDVRDSVLPRNQEIEAALAEHQRLFAGDEHARRLSAMRQAAVDAMTAMAAFEPRLVGSVLSGLASAHSDVQLHVFVDQSEAFELFLHNQGIECDMIERRLRVDRAHYRVYPAFVFAAGGFGFQVTVFPERDIRQAPLSLVDGTPMRRAKRRQVEHLLADEALRAQVGSG